MPCPENSLSSRSINSNLPEGPGFSRESESFLEDVLGFSLLRFARVDVQNEFQESVIIEVHEFIWFIDLIHHLNS